MNEQKNLFLAIGISILIIVIFQILFPQQAMINKPVSTETEIDHSKMSIGIYVLPGTHHLYII